VLWISLKRIDFGSGVWGKQQGVGTAAYAVRVFTDYYTGIQETLRWHLNGLHLYADWPVTFAVPHTEAISK
jgi:hypothetical protein